MAIQHSKNVAGPRVLVMISHPGIGSAIEALLRLERRYDVRWIKAPDPSRWQDWRPDLVIAEATHSESAPHAPRILLVGELPARPPGPVRERTRWLRRDAPSADLIGAVDAMLGLAGAAAPGTGNFALAAMSALALVAVLGYLLKALLR